MQLTLADLKGRIPRLERLARGLAKDPLAGAEAVRVVLARVVRRMGV